MPGTNFLEFVVHDDPGIPGSALNLVGLRVVGMVGTFHTRDASRGESWTSDIPAALQRPLVFSDNGIYHLDITVYDGDGGLDSRRTEFTVNNVAPTVEIGAGQTVMPGQTVSFSGANAFDPGPLDQRALRYAWQVTSNSGDVIVPTNATSLNFTPCLLYTSPSPRD